MVVLSKDEVKQRFSRRLNDLLDERGIPMRGRRQWLSRQFNGAFSPEAARKWLYAESIPDMAHLSMLCTAFGWSVEYLMTGTGLRHAGRVDEALAEVVDGWPQIDPEDQRALVRSLRNARDLKGIRPPPSQQPERSRQPARKGRRTQ